MASRKSDDTEIVPPFRRGDKQAFEVLDPKDA